MTDAELEALLEELEAALRDEVASALSGTASDFVDAVEGATELVAARFSVSGIRDMWRSRVPRILDRLRSIATRGARTVAEDLGEPLPDTWQDGLTAYTEATQALLDAVGENLATAASAALADGLSAGEDVDQLKARLVAVFSADGSQLGDARAARIAMTEATRAFNAGTLAAAQALTGPDRPLVKQWITRQDARVRDAHQRTNGQLRLIDEPFDVDGIDMLYPGDPAAPAALTVNCRCVLRTATASRNTATAAVAPGRTRMDATAAADIQTGAMVALIPSEEDAARLALEGGEAVDQLHLTLFYLGNAFDWSPEQQGNLISRIAQSARLITPVTARVFGASQWNPDGDDPAWVWNVSDDQDLPGSSLHDAWYEVLYALGDGHDDPALPQQYTPWSPHICAAYGHLDPGSTIAALATRTGPVVFDRIRVAFAGTHTDFSLSHDLGAVVDDADDVDEYEPQLLTWSTPDGAGLAFEDQQTGDSRVFAPGALYWTDGPWPLHYAGEMNGGHDGARLAGAIHTMGRDLDRILGDGVLYLTQDAGLESALLLAQGAPLGVSVDLDDVDLDLLDNTDARLEADRLDLAASASAPCFTAHLATASLLPLPGGGWRLTGETDPSWTVNATASVGETSRVDIVAGPDGTVPAKAFELEAAAGDGGSGGLVVERQRSGDYLMRITKARIRGATLVTIPAYDRARITLDDPELITRLLASASDSTVTASAASGPYDRVVRHVRKSLVPVCASDAAAFLRLPIVAVRRYLARAAQRGELVRISRGSYVGPSEVAATAPVAELSASATGAVDLPVADRDTPWDGPGARSRVFQWADGDTSKLDRAFAYRDDDADPQAQNSRKLGYADVREGNLVIIPRGVFAAQAALEGARGGVDIPADQVDDVKSKLTAVRAHVDEVTGEEQMNDMQASAWSAMRDLPPMPAAWFAAPTDEELPPGGPGVNYKNGRVFGWVAQAGEPHAGFAKKITIESLGRIETQHFLRQRFTLDDGSTVKVGTFTMNVGHHRDGAECETSVCQFDDSRTVAGIVTVGMSERGMWFSGAAAPWLSEWDRRVFLTTQPSYHMKRGPSGNWQLRAVLSVPMPGHSSPLLASAVVDRANMALTAAGTMSEVEEAVAAAEAVLITEADTVVRDAAGRLVTAITATGSGIDYDRLADSLVAAMGRAEQRKRDEAEELEMLLAEARKLDPDTGTSEGV